MYEVEVEIYANLIGYILYLDKKTWRYFLVCLITRSENFYWNYLLMFPMSNISFPAVWIPLPTKNICIFSLIKSLYKKDVN